MDVHKCIKKRRDTRHFTSDIVPEEVLEKALMDAHLAPSVGLSEPWRFLRIESKTKKAEIKHLFQSATTEAAQSIHDPDRKEEYHSLKLEAILDAPIGIAIFCDYGVLKNFTIGTIGSRQALEWSCACAIQNMWLSLTAQGYGAGWVSILNYESFKLLFDVPNTWSPLGYFCIGKPSTDYKGEPMLQAEKWKKRSAKPYVKVI